MSAMTHDGRTLRMRTLIDEFTRERETGLHVIRFRVRIIEQILVQFWQVHWLRLELSYQRSEAFRHRRGMILVTIGAQRGVATLHIVEKRLHRHLPSHAIHIVGNVRPRSGVAPAMARLAVLQLLDVLLFQGEVL